MNQRTLYKTIEKIASRDYDSDDKLISAVLDEIIDHERINIIGGRVWKLQPEKKQYVLIHQVGEIEKLKRSFALRLDSYVTFNAVARKRTILAEETNRTLRKIGIRQYSATGVGSKIKVGRRKFYEYIMAFNVPTVHSNLVYTLNIISQVVSARIEKRRQEQESRELMTELDKARQLQRHILPEHRQVFGPYEIYGVSVPEKIVGGDFFNYLPFPQDDRQLGVVIGDAASKGISAAIQALFVSGALMMSVEYETKITTMMRRINDIVHRIFPGDRFLTMFYCELFIGLRGLSLFSNAGHSSPIFYSAKTGEFRLLEVTGPIIGLLPDQRYAVGTVNFSRGDLLLLYTDGVTEANNGSAEFGEERLMKTLKRVVKKSPKEITLEILQEVQSFSAQGRYHDDKTLVVIKRTR